MPLVPGTATKATAVQKTPDIITADRTCRTQSKNGFPTKTRPFANAVTSPSAHTFHVSPLIDTSTCRVPLLNFTLQEMPC